jgi:hypothetical protein
MGAGWELQKPPAQASTLQAFPSSQSALTAQAMSKPASPASGSTGSTSAGLSGPASTTSTSPPLPAGEPPPMPSAGAPPVPALLPPAALPPGLLPPALTLTPLPPARPPAPPPPPALAVGVSGETLLMNVWSWPLQAMTNDPASPTAPSAAMNLLIMMLS